MDGVILALAQEGADMGKRKLDPGTHRGLQSVLA
jgi:hypothetical protein